MRTLTKEESERYMSIVIEGNMDKMFDFGYQLGSKDADTFGYDINNEKPKNENK